MALVLILGLGYLVLTFTGRFYYEPLCQRYAESKGLTYVGYTPGRTKWGLPDECFFRDANGNTSRVLVSDIPPTSADWVRWVLSWVAVVAGMGGLVWAASLVGGFKPGRRRR